tara:strand:- start:573 stop:758 length:186 start_codon:yes stop_codon:yes gene_type:complete
MIICTARVVTPYSSFKAKNYSPFEIKLLKIKTFASQVIDSSFQASVKVAIESLGVNAVNKI